MDHIPAAMDRHFDVLRFHADGGLLVGASSLTGRYWLGSLWFYGTPEVAPDVESCSAGLQLEAGLCDAAWVNNNRILLALDTGGVALWELQDNCKTFTMLHSACEHDHITSSVSVNADVSQFVSTSHDKGIKVWNADLESLHTYRGHFDVVSDAEFHPTEPSLFLSCSQDGRTLVWDTRKSKPASMLGGSTHGLAPTCVSWQPSAPKMFCVGDEGGHVVVRDLRMVVEKTVSSRPHTRRITSLAFSIQQPSLLASTSEDCTVAVISLGAVDSSPVLYSSTGHCDYVSGCAWHSKEAVWTCGWDGQVLQHTVDNAVPNGKPNVQINGELEQEQA